MKERAAEYLERECRWLDLVLARQVLRLRSLRDLTDNRFAGLYIADNEADEMLRGADTSAPDSDLRITIAACECDEMLEASPDLPVSRLMSRFGLSRFESRVLFLAAAPELDLRYQTLYAYAQNDVTKKAATIDLILKMLCGARSEQWSARKVFAANGLLFKNALLRFADEERSRDAPLLSQAIHAPRRMVDFLLGQDAIDVQLQDFTECLNPRANLERLDISCELKQRLHASIPLLRNGGVAVLQGRPGSGRRRAAEALAASLGLELVVCDVSRAPDIGQIGPLLRRECLLSNSALYLHGAHSAELLPVFENSTFPVFLGAGVDDMPAATGRRAALRFEFAVPDMDARRMLWAQELNGSGAAPGAEISSLAGKFRFTAGQIRDTVSTARQLAGLRLSAGGRVKSIDIHAAARAQCNPELEKLAARSELPFDWNDLVLPEKVLQQLREVSASVRLRHRVQCEWRFDSKTGNNMGASVLFSGLSGTGKTMAASVLARDLALDLYKIDLSNVVSKYIGDTEKNLNRIFDEAEYSGAVLFFDEADALFGKRSEVKDAHDRWANIEVAFLLQRMEQFSGLAILATNLSKNMDAAFVRRMQHTIEFPFPDAAHRERIWRGMFPEAAPIASDVDFAFLARQFELSGGNIRNIVTAAAFLAASAEEPIGMEHLARATGREFQKMGKLPSKAEFREHFDVISKMLG